MLMVTSGLAVQKNTVARYGTFFASKVRYLNLVNIVPQLLPTFSVNTVCCCRPQVSKDGIHNSGHTPHHPMQDWSERDLRFADIAQDQGSFVAGSLLAVSPMSTEAISALAKLTAENNKQAFVQVKALGGALTAQPGNPSAFPWRDALFEMQVSG